MGKAGRPKAAPINWETVDAMLLRGASGAGVAHSLGISYSLFALRGEEDGRWGPDAEFSNFSEYRAQKRSVMADSIIMKQMEVAMGKKDPETGDYLIPPNTTMLIWVGKQYAEQSDRQDVKHTGEVPVTTINIRTASHIHEEDEEE